MIYSSFLTTSRANKKYFTGEIAHYMPVPHAAYVNVVDYRLNRGESLYVAARKLFADQAGGGENWAYVAECNRLRRPQDWREGDAMVLPQDIVAAEVRLPPLDV